MGGAGSILVACAAIAACVAFGTVVVAVLVHRELDRARAIVACGGVNALSVRESGSIVVHLCLLLGWIAFLRVSFGALMHTESLRAMAGAGGLLTALAVKAAMCGKTTGAEAK
jgi:hypothetical protein